jgi:hypothetical protein
VVTHGAAVDYRKMTARMAGRGNHLDVAREVVVSLQEQEPGIAVP